MRTPQFLTYLFLLANVAKLRNEKGCASEVGVDLLILLLCVEGLFRVGIVE